MPQGGSVWLETGSRSGPGTPRLPRAGAQQTCTERRNHSPPYSPQPPPPTMPPAAVQDPQLSLEITGTEGSQDSILGFVFCLKGGSDKSLLESPERRAGHCQLSRPCPTACGCHLIGLPPATQACPSGSGAPRPPGLSDGGHHSSQGSPHGPGRPVSPTLTQGQGAPTRPLPSHPLHPRVCPSSLLNPRTPPGPAPS